MHANEDGFVLGECPVCNQFIERDGVKIELEDGSYPQCKGKDYKRWTYLKEKVNNSGSPRVLFHEREIWDCGLGENIGFEQDGKGKSFLRPVLIIKKFNHDVLWGIPLTTSKKKGHPYYYNFSFVEGVQSSAILSQIRLIDAKRLSHLMGYMSKPDFEEIKKKLKGLLQ